MYNVICEICRSLRREKVREAFFIEKGKTRFLKREVIYICIYIYIFLLINLLNNQWAILEYDNLERTRAHHDMHRKVADRQEG